MMPRKQKNLRQPPCPDVLRVMHAHAAGIDVHSNVHWVAVPPEDVRQGQPTTRLSCLRTCVLSALARPT